MGKKVGILSMQRVINYGSYLQAYALKQMLINNGASSVEYIDIVKGRELKGYEYSGLPYKLRRLKALLKLIVGGRVLGKKRTIAFMKDVRSKIEYSWGILGLSKQHKQPVNLDLAVIGSDEVFHCCQSTSWGFTHQLYGDIPQAKVVCSYAGSFGGTKLSDIKRLGIENEISSELKKLTHISVRDKNSEEIVKAICGITPLRHIDPVLAYGFNEELNQSNAINCNDYILIYSYPDRINQKQEIKAIVDFAKVTGKKLVSIMSRYNWCDLAVIPSPLEMLSWFKNADYVISETFHGTIFSIISHKKFVTIGRESSIPKLTSMLEPYSLEHRLLHSMDDLRRVIDEPVDYDNVEEILSQLRHEASGYLKKILSE